MAHSITLVAATLGWVHVPGPPVEAMIALSIVFVAAEIIRGLRGKPGLTARAPWIVAFSFGLLHGFGFAGALAEVGLPQKAIPVALLTFNVGVELGQLIFVALVVAVRALLARVPAKSSGVDTLLRALCDRFHRDVLGLRAHRRLFRIVPDRTKALLPAFPALSTVPAGLRGRPGGFQCATIRFGQEFGCWPLLSRERSRSPAVDRRNPRPRLRPRRDGDAAATAADAAPTAAPLEATDQTWTPEAMEALLAPVALYPDAVLSQVLMASTNPQEVLDAGNWLIANPEIEGKALDDATEKAGFTPPMRGLMQFRPIVDQLCLEMGWTTEIGQAFTNDQPGVLAAVQRLRSQAMDAGNLQDSPQMKVVEESQDGQEAIILEPQDPKVVYVPTYDPVAAYAPAPAAAAAPATTTVTEEKGHSTGSMIATGVLAFGAGLLVGEIFDDDDDDYYHHGSHYYPNYHGGYYPPPPRPYHYNPVYGGGYRPGYSYNRPPSYNNVLSNNNVVVVNNNRNNNYWNDFDDRATGKPRAKTLQSPITKAKPNRSDLASVEQQGEVADLAEQEGSRQLCRREQGSTREGEIAAGLESHDRESCFQCRGGKEQGSRPSRRPGLCRRAAGWRPCGNEAFEARRGQSAEGCARAFPGHFEARFDAFRVPWRRRPQDRCRGPRSRFQRSRSKPEGPVEHAAGREEQVEVGPEEAALGETP